MRNKILEILQNADTYISGEEISQKLGVSRAAVWKHIKKLKSDGYDIASVTNKGYKFMKSEDMFSGETIKEKLKTDFMATNICFLNMTDSTNEEAKRHSDMPDGTLFVSEIQTGGKGRLGRNWASERGVGVWMSLLLKPNLLPQEISQITLIAGIAVCKALGNNFMIKWPNDIVAETKKVCGILTEMSAEMERVNYVICGIGINVNNEKFDEELLSKATSMYLYTGKKQNRAKIAAAVMNEFEPLYKIFLKSGFEGVRDIYKEHCITLEREVQVIYKNKTVVGKAVDISADGGLEVETDQGRITVTSGEVSVRGVYGYI